MKIVPGGRIAHGGLFVPDAPPAAPETLADIVPDAVAILNAQIMEWNDNHPDEPDEIMTDLRDRLIAARARQSR